MGRRTPGRRVPPRRPDGRRVAPPPGRPEPRRPSPRGNVPSPRPSTARGPFAGVVTAAAADKLRGPVRAPVRKNSPAASRAPVRSKYPEPGSFVSMLNALEQQKKEAQAKTGSSALSPKQIAETMVNEKAKSGTPFDGDVFRGTLENLQKMKEEKRKKEEERTREAFLKDMEEKAKQEQAGTRDAVPGFSATKFLELKNKLNPDFKDLTEGGTKKPSDILISKLEDMKREKDEKRRAEEAKKGIPFGGTADDIGRDEAEYFDADAFRAKLEELQRKKEEGNRGRGIRGGSRPVRRTGGKPRTVRRTGGRPAPFFSPRPTRPTVIYGRGPFGIPFGRRPSRPAPFFSPRPTRPTVIYGRGPFGIPFGRRNR